MLEESRRIFLQIESAKTKNTLNEKVRRKSAAAGTKVSLCVLSFVWMLFYISAFTDKIYCTFKFNLAESLLRRYLLLNYKWVERWRCQFCCHCWENLVQTEKFMCKTEKIAYKTENEIRWKVLNRGLRYEKHFQSCFLPTMH